MWTWYQQLLKRGLEPWYTRLEIERATRYYVETKCQNVAPSKDDEPGRAYAFAAKEPIIPFFLNKAFQAGPEGHQLYLVLADSGMGKTTFLINLYLRYRSQSWRPPYAILLFPLSAPEIDREIERIPDRAKPQTILLFDAFDEDIHAVQDYKARLHELIGKAAQFRRVVLTCRTQFFPSEEEEPHETGVLRIEETGGQGRELLFRKFYLSPFDEEDIRVYLRRRFSWLQRAKRAKAQQIVDSCPHLMVRPMLLSYIEDLLQSETAYTSAYMVYAELIHKWIEREAQKAPPERQKHYMEELFQFSRDIAVDLSRRRAERQGRLAISGNDIQPFADEHGIKLHEMEMKSRSLLNRSARSDYKFSHKSVLEYFLAEEARLNPAFREEIGVFEGMDQAKAFFEEMIWEQLTAPFFSRTDLKGEYCLKDGKPRPLAKVNINDLSGITRLKLNDWDSAEDDLLLFRGLPRLEVLDVTEAQITPTQHNALKQMLPKCRFGLLRPLRSSGITVSEKKYEEIFELDGNGRPRKYIQNDYEDQGKVVVDHVTGLIWQKSGSPESMYYKNVQDYVKGLNRQKFGGYTDWRLPTIPELISLLEPEKQSNNLYIDPIFDRTQGWCWSADEVSGSSGAAWHVYFDRGDVHWYYVSTKYDVRCVRS